MDFTIFCDETLPDLFTTKKQYNKKLMIGSLWIETELKEDTKEQIKLLRKKHNCWGEIKWTKVSLSKEAFYLELIDLFFSYGLQMRFRAICIDPKEINWALHNNDKELGFYKFYYFLLHKWFVDFNEYAIFCDSKVNRDLSRLKVLHKILETSNRNINLKNVQALPSKEVVLIQLADFLLGATSSVINETIHSNKSKIKVIKYLEKHLDRSIAPTSINEKKFNIFNINLEGGW
jgi:hypothetical protein